MKTLIIKGKDRLWPTVTWADSNLSILYLGSEDDDVTVRETNSVDFEEFFLHLDKGGSIFLTMKPDTPDRKDEPREGAGFRCILNKNLPELVEDHMDPGVGMSAQNWGPEEVRSWR
ncbi:MAG: hypothetical protein V3S09_05540 [Candidatus Bathyarchaeia archaeon]